MEQKETNYIRLDAANSASSPENNIFNELGWDLDFGSIQAASQHQEPFSWIDFWYKSSYVVMVILIVVSILGTIDTFIKSSNDNSILSLIPGCEFFATYGTSIPNTECLTSPMLLDKETKTLTNLEDGIAKSLAIVLPKTLELTNVLTMPEVRFIQENTGRNRINIVDMLAQFQKIKNESSIYGSSIDCKIDLVNERGDLSVNCNAYGARLLGTSTSDITSRNVAVTFIDKLATDPKSQFIVVDAPKSFDINQFMSTDPGKTYMNTQTTFSLKLKFTPNTQL